MGDRAGRGRPARVWGPAPLRLLVFIIAGVHSGAHAEFCGSVFTFDDAFGWVFTQTRKQADTVERSGVLSAAYQEGLPKQ